MTSNESRIGICMSAFLVTVASYRNLHEALLAKGSLESVGIKCVLGNEHTGRMLGTNAVGGLRLQVHQRDADTATGLLSSGIPAVFFTEKGELYLQPSCPRCDALDVRCEDRSLFDTFMAWLMSDSTETPTHQL